jgi:hypothetical protein
MIFPASLWVMSQAVAIHLSLVITCFIFLNLILIPYFIAVAQTYGMPSTSVQGMRYSTPAPSPSTAHKFPVSAPKISTSRHVVNLCSPSPSTVHKLPVSAPIIPKSAHQSMSSSMSLTSVQEMRYPTPTPSPSRRSLIYMNFPSVIVTLVFIKKEIKCFVFQTMRVIYLFHYF